MERDAILERVEGLEEIVADDPDDVAARFMLGTELAKIDEHARAEVQFREVIARDPDYTAGWRGLGKALGAQGRVEEAVEVLTKGLEVAARTGDLQSGREMEVYLRRYSQADRSS
ncbi:MAG: tetratricopeptide repeat protein [Myxococcota bacterium]